MTPRTYSHISCTTCFRYAVGIPCSVSPEQIRYVFQYSIFYDRHAAGDEVCVMTDSKIGEPAADGLGEPGQFTDGFGFSKVVVIRHKGSIEKLRKQDEVAFVTADQIGREHV